MSDLPHLLRLASFVAFLFLAARAARAKEAARRAAVSQFIAYVLALSAIAGFSQVDNWPFSQYTLAAYLARTDKPICWTDFTGTNAQGTESRIDPLAWSPVYSSILQYWFERNYETLLPSEREEVMRFLLAKAETSRQRMIQGKSLGFERRIGRMANTYWWVLPRVRSASSTPYVDLRAYRVCVTPALELRGSGGPSRQLVARWPQ